MPVWGVRDDPGGRAVRREEGVVVHCNWGSEEWMEVVPVLHGPPVPGALAQVWHPRHPWTVRTCALAMEVRPGQQRLHGIATLPPRRCASRSTLPGDRTRVRQGPGLLIMNTLLLQPDDSSLCSMRELHAKASKQAACRRSPSEAVGSRQEAASNHRKQTSRIWAETQSPVSGELDQLPSCMVGDPVYG